MQKTLSIIFITMVITLILVLLLVWCFVHYRIAEVNPTKIETYSLNEIMNAKHGQDHSFKKVLVFNSFSYKDNKIPEYAKYSTIINKLYCDRYGYIYKQINHPVDEMPPYWLRVKDAYEILNQGIYDIVVYLDLDAIFYDFERPLADIIDNDYNFYIGSDPKLPFSYGMLNNIVNTGCFIIKNNKWSRDFVQNWLYACMDENGVLSGVCKHDWNISRNKWKCEGCNWAGIKYEQGMLGNLYISNVQNAQKHVCIFDQEVLSNTNPSKKSFVLHMMDTNDSDREHVFKTALEQVHQQNL